MGDLIVKPSYQLSERDILTVDKINLMATPVVELALEDPVNDQNFFRNGNFYSSFWKTPAGLSCPVGVWTTNASYWLCNPSGAAVNFLRSSIVPDLYSLFSGEIQGAPSVTDVEFGQQISGDLCATMRRNVTFSGYMYNATGLVISPKLKIYTADAFNNFGTITLQTTVNLQSGPDSSWTYMTATLDLTLTPNVANGMLIAILIPGALNATTKNVLFSRLKIQIGEVATEFVDDTSLFVQSPSVDSTMLQDGCIARPSLFLPNVVPKGAYQAKSIESGDIDDKAVAATNLADGAAVANLGFTPINKTGDTAIGPGALNFVNDDVVGAGSVAGASAIIAVSSAKAANDGYMPAISFDRPGSVARAIGLNVAGRFRTVDRTGVTGYLLDSVFQVATVDLQDKAVTIAKLAQEVINMIIPSGIMAFFSGPNPPGGWFVADGHAISRTTYAALFAAIGTYWGSGDNVSTFNLPDLRGRVPIGYVNTPAGGITARAFASRGGEETHQISIAEMPGHDHGYSQSPHDHGTHTHSIVVPVGAGNGIASGSGWAVGGANVSASGVPASNANISFTGQGGWAAHNNMQPFSVGYWIVKA